MNGPSTVAVRVAFVTLIPIIIGCAIGCARFVPELIVRSARVRELITPAIGRQGAIPRQGTTLLLLLADAAFQRHDERAADLPEHDVPCGNGNNDVVCEDDVADAVAEYELDADGGLYEVHSPQTQLPRLGSPKS